MELTSSYASGGWRGALSLHYDRAGVRTVLRRRQHIGPLRVQRDLYPEGEHTCHTIVVHPPGGIAGGDVLDLEVKLDAGSEALLTTPGAGKWYGSTGAEASQSLRFSVGPAAVLEWLPQETILYDRARARMNVTVHLDEGARYLGWEILCLGRSASGERYNLGSLHLNTDITRAGRRMWIERADLQGGDALLGSPVGLAGYTVCATMIAAGLELDDATATACRGIDPGEDALGGLTRLPGLAIARFLGHDGEQARSYFEGLWVHLRPQLKGCVAVRPRIWAT